MSTTPVPATTVSTELLFQPFEFGNITLPNRIVMAPMTRSKSPNNIPGQDVAAYYRRRADGGVGLIVTEGTMPDHKAASGYPDVPAFYGAESLAGWKRVVDEVHEVGGYIIPQLWHVGSIRKTGMGPDPAIPPYAPSPVAHPSFEGKGEIPHEMTQDEINECVEGWARSAKHAQDIGFDGLEIHGAHSYLIDQFFWEATNKRTDHYGGALPQRTRFAVEIIQAIRAAVGPDFPIVFRYSQWKQGDYTHKMATTPEELEAFLTPLSEAGVDYFHASNRRFSDPEFEGSTLNLAGWSKKITNKPAITVGSVGLDSDFLRTYAGKDTTPTNLDALIERMENQEFELVAVGRALLADPQWANKVRDGKEDTIIPFERKHMAELT